MEDRLVVLAGALIEDAVTQPLDILEQLLALETDLLLYVIEESVGQDVCLLNDHLVDVVVAIVTRLCEDWDPLVSQSGVILVSDDLSHQLTLCLSDSIEACLCHAVADGGVILLTIGVCVLVDQISHLAEVGDLLTLIERGDLLHDHRDEVLSEEERITASGSGVLYGSAVAMSDGTILQHEEYRDGLSCLTYACEALCYRLTDVEVTVILSTLLDGTLVIEVKAGLTGGTYYLLNFHRRNGLKFSCLL